MQSFIFPIIITLLLTPDVSKAISNVQDVGDVGKQMAEEEEFCMWMLQRCPYLSSKFRPLENPSEIVDVSLIFYARRFLGIDDVRQTFKIQGLFYILWPLPPCAAMDGQLALAENVSEMAAKTQSCRFDSNSMWSPFIYLTNIYDGTINVISENMQFISIFRDEYPIAQAQSAGSYDITADLDFSVRENEIVSNYYLNFQHLFQIEIPIR